MKKSPMIKAALSLVVLSFLLLTACTGKASPQTLQTAVAATLAAAPNRPGPVVTHLVEVTQVVEVTAPAVSNAAASDTPASQDTATGASSATPGDTATPTATLYTGLASDTPTLALQSGTPYYNSLQYVVDQYFTMTDLQKTTFAASLAGKTVSWFAAIQNITADGQVVLKFPFERKGTVTLLGVPEATALQINRGYQVVFTGMIESFDTSFNNITISSTKIIDFYVEPTATITPTPTKPITPTPTDSGYACRVTSTHPGPGETVKANTAFTWSWEVKNVGSAQWGQHNADVRYTSGTKMQTGSSLFDMPSTVMPRDSVTITVAMLAPASPGAYTATWQIRQDSLLVCVLPVSVNVTH